MHVCARPLAVPECICPAATMHVLACGASCVARMRALVTRPLLEAGIAVISSSGRVGDRRRVPLPYLVGDGGQRHRQRWLRR
jgi:hypothetical protein